MAVGKPGERAAHGADVAGRRRIGLLALAGALYVQTDATFKKQLLSFGPIFVGHDLNQGSGGIPGIVWKYTVDTLGVGSATPAGPPIVAYPMSF